MFQSFGGTQNVTADTIIGEVGKATRIFAIHVISGTASVVALRSGETVSGTIWIQETGTANTGKTFSYGQYGALFPSGCFCDVDANIVSCQVEFAQETR